MPPRRAAHWGALGVALFVLLFLQTSCNVTRHLDASKGERLLVRNALHVQSEKKLTLGAKTALSYELTPLYRQKPNTRSFGFFHTRLWLYYRYKDRNSKFSRWIISKQAEKPAVYDSTLAYRTATNFQNQMRQRGYFRATCKYSPNYIGAYKASVVYDLNLGPQYTIDTVTFASRDTQVLDILRATRGASHIKMGAPLDGQLFEAEKQRITVELKNRGYAYFFPQFVEFTGDSSGTKSTVRVEVLPFNDSTMHKVYSIGKVEVYSGVVPEVTTMRTDTTINGVYFAGVESKFFVRPDRLYKTIAIRPGQIYRQEDFDLTLRNLNSLGVYRFVSMRPVQDSTQEGKMDVMVNLSPNQRFSIGGGVDFNYSTLSDGLIGISPSLLVNNRNLFSGAERLRTTVDYNIEFNIAVSSLIYAQEFKIQNELAFPRSFDYLSLWKTLHRIKVGHRRLVPDRFYQQIGTAGNARIVGNYNYLKVTNFYQYHLLTASFGYFVRPNSLRSYSWDHIGIDVLRPDFATNLNPSKFLQLTFDDQLFTGFILRSFNYNYNSRMNGYGERWTYHFNTELSGLEIFALHRGWVAAFGKQDWAIDKLTFSQFFRLDQDVVYSRNFSQQVVGAVRFGMGLGMPFGDSQTVPYVKQFYVGGPSSIRAFRIREIGPGSYVQIDPSTGEPQKLQQYYQAADFRFEFSGELRFPIFSYFKGAVFLDGGNVWTLKYDSGRPGSQLGTNFYKSIALGTGVGIRGDFGYFVIRFDLGVPVRTPYRNPRTNSNWVTDYKLNKVNPNLAIGFPF